MKKIYLLPFFLFETIKRKKINIFFTISFGLFVGVLSELIVLLFYKNEMSVYFESFLKNSTKNDLNILLLYVVSAFYITIITIFLRILFGWLGFFILEKKRAKLIRIAEIICYSFFTCFFGLIPFLGVIIEFIFTAYFVYAGFKILLETNNWKAIIAAILISLIRFEPTFYSFVG